MVNVSHASLFGFELLFAFSGERVKLGAAIIFRRAPFRGDPSAAFEPMESGIERALLHAQHVARDLLEPFGNRPAVLGFVGDTPQDQQVQSALRQFDPRRHSRDVPLLLRQESTQLLVEVQGVDEKHRIESVANGE